MTTDELATIRERITAVGLMAPVTRSRLVQIALEDAPALVAEVQRLDALACALATDVDRLQLERIGDRAALRQIAALSQSPQADEYRAAQAIGIARAALEAES